MTRSPGLLTIDDIGALLSIAAAHDALLVGGQAIALHAQSLRGLDGELDAMDDLTTADIDLVGSPSAAIALAAALTGASLVEPGPDDHTPNAAVITGEWRGQTVLIDMMRSVKGVDLRVAAARAMPLPVGTTLVRTLHPLDCLRSRLANINDLGRHDQHSVQQAEAAVHVLGLNLRNDFHGSPAATREAMKVVRELEHVIRRMHRGRDTATRHGDSIRPGGILIDLAGDERIDARWRRGTLEGIILRSSLDDHKAPRP